MNYGLPDGYITQVPAHYVEGDDDLFWQPEVYPFAAQLARHAGSKRLIDVGCSTGGKLLGYADQFDLIGISQDVLPDGDGRWIAHDLDSADRLPLHANTLKRSFLICSDVIEHLARPERLVAALVAALRHADGLVLSTPDRERTRGPGDMGPPANPCHAREWTAAELVDWLEAEGLTVKRQFWQRSHVGAEGQATVVVEA